MSIDISQFYQVFFEESAEHLAEMERLLLELDVEAPGDEELNAIFRAAHSIKGGSGTFGFTDMTEVTHVLENLLDRLRKGEMAPRIEMIDAFLEAADVLKDQLSCHINGTNADPQPAHLVCEKLRALADSETPPSVEPEADTATSVDEDAASSSDSAPDMAGVEPQAERFAIEFHPDKSFRKRENALDDLCSELSRLGTLTSKDDLVQDGNSVKEKSEKNKKIKKAKKGKKTVVHQWTLMTTAGIDAIQDIFAFIAAPDEIVITRLDIPAGSNDSPTLASDEDDGYGFFAPLDASGEEDQNSAYGFFEPVPDQLSDPGYGLFEELPSQAEQTPALVEEGDGFGFFSPLPAHQPETSTTPDRPVAKSPEKKIKDKPAAPAAGNGETSIRVSVERVDQLINLVGELVITQAMLAQSAAGVDSLLYEKLHHGLAQLEHNTRELQDAVMSIRMMPISFVFSRFPRVVRDLASKLNKQVELVTLGENTELDKGLIEKIADPLTHLVRNSLDHGIESPESRMAVGKPPKGTITLSASHQGGNIVIEVIDDGGGLNREKIISKAVERGFSVSESMPDADVWMLIFEPGFSTADVITDVSGRGVGMDVVKRNITAMGGSIQIASAAGQGTTMTIRLPLTLAILDGMVVALGDGLYVIPLNLIVETLQPKPEDLKKVTGQGHMVHVRGEYLPIIALHKLFNLPTEVTDPCNGVLVLIEAGEKKVALFVDRLVGQQQVVIKSLETNFRKIVGISGATIMGDGTVALILDVATLIRLGQ